MTTRKKGVSLHESQNITHEFEDCVPKEERVPSIMDMLQAGGTKSDASAVQKPSLMEVLQEQEQQQAQQKAHQGTRKLERSASEKALPCMLSVKTSLDADGNQQLSLSIDDATKDVLTGLLKMANTDELKSTPPLDFFAAAGMPAWSPWCLGFADSIAKHSKFGSGKPSWSFQDVDVSLQGFWILLHTLRRIQRPLRISR